MLIELYFLEMSDFSDDEAFLEAVGGIAEPKKLPSGSSGRNWNCIQVAAGQSQNPVLEMVKTVPWQVGETPVDFQTSPDVGVLYLSLKYHNYRPKYIEERVREIPRGAFRAEFKIVHKQPFLARKFCRKFVQKFKF